jgi:hypothetical protein
LLSPSGQKLYTWHLHVKAGVTVVRLPMPPQIRRPGVYTLVWVARAGADTLTRRVKVRIVGSGGGEVLNPPTAPVEVVLAGNSNIRRDLALGLDGTAAKVVLAAGDQAFDLAGDSTQNVQVIVVDVDQYGVGLVRDLHTVFPAIRIVAIATGPKTLAAAVRAGAAIAVPRSTPAAKLAEIVARLARPRG